MKFHRSPERWDRKIYWLGVAGEWLSQRGYPYFDLNDCLERLEQDPECREAALAAFWKVYLVSHEMSTSERDEQVERINKILDTPFPPDAPKETREAIAFSKMHLAGVLMVLLISAGTPLSESPGATEAIEKVLQASEYLEPYEYGEGKDITKDLINFSNVLVCGIASIEKARWRSENQEYEEAFSLIADGAEHLCLVDYGGEEVPYLPSSGKKFEVQEAVDIFEHLKRRPEKVKSWARVKEICQKFDRMSDPYPSGFGLGEWTITDGNGNQYDSIFYWRRAVGFAECKMSPSEFWDTLRHREAENHSQRLKTDFFGESWEHLEPKTRESLIQMEINWYVSPERGGRLEAAANELRLAFEHEMNAIVFRRIGKAVNQILQNKELKKQLNLKSRNASNLSLSEMASLLKEASNEHSLRVLSVRQFIEALPLPDTEKGLLYVKLPEYALDLARVRRKPEHRDNYNQIAREIRELRNQALGIGIESLLLRLAQIKMRLRQKANP